MYNEKIVTSKGVTYIRMRISTRIERLPDYLYVLQTVLSYGSLVQVGGNYAHAYLARY